MMKQIVFICPNIRKEGAVHSLVALQVYLNNVKKISTLVIIPEHGPVEELFQKNNINYLIHYFAGSVNVGRGIKILRGLSKYFINRIQAVLLKQKIKNINISCIHSNTITSDFGYYVSKIFKVPHIWHIREFGKYDFNYDYELGMNYISRCANKAAKIICVSKSVAEYYRKYFNPEIITYVYNGVPIIPKGTNCWEKSEFRMILIGRISCEKNQELAIRACKKLYDEGYQNFCLDLYGDGIDTEKIKRLVLQLGLNDKIHFMGYSNNIPINDYHVGLMCSKCEAFGRVSVEYMANHLPVIGTDNGGTAEIIEDGKTGFLVKPNDIDGFLRCMERFYDNRNLCIELGSNGFKRAQEMFSQETYCRNILKIYEQILE